MTRVIIFDALLFLSPFVVYAFWKWLFRGARGHKEILSDAPILVLVLLGSLLGVGGLYFLVSKDQAGPMEHYYPPKLDANGQIAPGYFKADTPPPSGLKKPADK